MTATNIFRPDDIIIANYVLVLRKTLLNARYNTYIPIIVDK